MIRPVKANWRITDTFGNKYFGQSKIKRKFPHSGVDYVSDNRNIYAPENGVVSTHRGKAEGNWVLLKGSGGYHHFYHLASFGKTGSVKQGDKIGVMGSTGNSTGIHLHHTLRRGGSSSKYNVDPLKFIKEDTKVASKTFVTQVYKSVLQRNPDGGGLAFYTGKDTEYVMNHIYNSAEAQAVRAREAREDKLRAEMTKTIAQLKNVNKELSERPSKKDLELAQKANAELAQKVADLQKQLDDKPNIPPHQPIEDGEVGGWLRKLIRWIKGVISE